MRTYRELFAIREYSVLFVARCFVMLGVVIGNLALGTIVFQTTGSPLLTGIALFGGPLIQLVTSHFLARHRGPDPAAERDDPRRPHLGGHRPVPADPRPGLGLAVRAWSPSATSSCRPPRRHASWPWWATSSRADGFVLARSTMSVLVGGMQVIGNGIGGLLLLWFATTHLFLISASMTFVAVLIARLGLADHPPRATGKVVGRTRAVNRRCSARGWSARST